MESGGPKGEEVVVQGHHGRSLSKNLKVVYTNIDGLISGALEMKDCVLSNEPDVVCITETKLKEEIQISFKEQGYNVWRRNRKGKAGKGVMILVRDDI